MWAKHKAQQDTQISEDNVALTLPHWWVHVSFLLVAAIVALGVFFGGSTAQPAAPSSEVLNSCTGISGGEIPQALRELILTAYVNQLSVELEEGGMHPPGNLKEQVGINNSWEVSMPDGRRFSLEAGRRLMNRDLARAWLGRSLLCSLTQVAGNSASPVIADTLAKLAMTLADRTTIAAADDAAKFRTESKPPEGAPSKPILGSENKTSKPKAEPKSSSPKPSAKSQ